MPPKRQKIVKSQSKIEKFLVRKEVENVESNSDDDELKVQINDLKEEVDELLKEKRKLECSRLPKPYKLKDISVNYNNIKYENSSFGVLTKQLQLKFHEFAGCVISNVNDEELIAKFRIFGADKTHTYAIKLINQDETGNYTFSKCFMPPIIKIQELLKQYPPRRPKRLLDVISTACQVYHDIENQVDQLKDQVKDRNVKIFNSINNRMIVIDFQMVQRSTAAVFPVNVQLDYDIYYPRPVLITVQAEDMPSSTLKIFRKQCKFFKRFTLWNAFEIITNIGIKQHESVFYLLQSSEHELIKSNSEHLITSKNENRKHLDQILRDFSENEQTEEISNASNKSFESHSMIDKSNKQINKKTQDTSSYRFKTKAEIHNENVSHNDPDGSAIKQTSIHKSINSNVQNPKVESMDINIDEPNNNDSKNKENNNTKSKKDLLLSKHNENALPILKKVKSLHKSKNSSFDSDDSTIKQTSIHKSINSDIQNSTSESMDISLDEPNNKKDLLLSKQKIQKPRNQQINNDNDSVFSKDTTVQENGKDVEKSFTGSKKKNSKHKRNANKNIKKLSPNKQKIQKPRNQTINIENKNQHNISRVFTRSQKKTKDVFTRSQKKRRLTLIDN